MIDVLQLCGPPWHCYAAAVLRRGEPQTGLDAADRDERWVAALAQGDQEALGKLYDRFAPSMLALGQRILGASREAEDLVQDVFLEVWHRARYYDRSRGSVRTWLMLRLRSRALDRLRATKRAALTSLEVTNLPEPAHEDAVLSTDAPALQRALGQLPEDQRVALELSYFSGLTCAEIALRLDLPIGTVKSRLSRAIARLRTQLEPQKRGLS